MSKDFFPKHARQHRKTPYFAQIFSDILPHFPTFSLSFFSFFHRSVTLVTAKKQHCGWSARTYAHLCASTRAREKRSPKIFSPRFSSFSLLPPSSLPLSSFPLTFLFFSSREFSTCKSAFCYVCITDLKLSKEKNAHFLDFFTLCGNIDPYINRGMRCNPPSVQELMTCIEH